MCLLWLWPALLETAACCCFRLVSGSFCTRPLYCFLCGKARARGRPRRACHPLVIAGSMIYASPDERQRAATPATATSSRRKRSSHPDHALRPPCFRGLFCKVVTVQAARTADDKNPGKGQSKPTATSNAASGDRRGGSSSGGGGAGGAGRNRERKVRLMHVSRPLMGGLSWAPENAGELDMITVDKYTAVLKSYPGERGEREERERERERERETGVCCFGGGRVPGMVG